MQIETKPISADAEPIKAAPKPPAGIVIKGEDTARFAKLGEMMRDWGGEARPCSPAPKSSGA